MALLNDAEIRRLCLTTLPPGPMIEPYSAPVSGGGVISYGETAAGYDLRLGRELWVFRPSYHGVVDPKQFKRPDGSANEEYVHGLFDVTEPLHDERGWYYVLPPGAYALGASVEYLRIPRHLKGRCVGKSTYARCMVFINTTPLEPGWEGYLTIEIGNVGPRPAVVYADEGIAQLEFETLTGAPDVDYGQKGGKYQGQGSAPVPSRVN